MPMLDRDGVRINYETVGPATAPAILFSHGYAATHEMWSTTTAALARDYRCITWDLRGHGASDAPDDPDRYSLALSLDDMAAILDAESIDRTVLIGHSLGGYLSLRFHERSPKRVAALILVDTGPGYRNAEGRAAWNDICESFAVQYDTNGLDALENSSPEVAAASHQSAVGLVHGARRILTQHDAVALDHLPAIDVPTLVIVGSNDRPFLASSEYMGRKISGAHHVVIDGAAHAPMLTQPEPFQREVGSFLEQRPPS